MQPPSGSQSARAPPGLQIDPTARVLTHAHRGISPLMLQQQQQRGQLQQPRGPSPPRSRSPAVPSRRGPVTTIRVERSERAAALEKKSPDSLAPPSPDTLAPPSPWGLDMQAQQAQKPNLWRSHSAGNSAAPGSQPVSRSPAPSPQPVQQKWQRPWNFGVAGETSIVPPLARAVPSPLGHHQDKPIVGSSSSSGHDEKLQDEKDDGPPRHRRRRSSAPDAWRLESRAWLS